MAKQQLTTNKSYETGIKLKTKITNPQYAMVGNLDPAAMRAINIKKANALLQKEWAAEWLKAVKTIEACRAEIEKISSEIEKTHFETEQEVDEYVLKALLAKAEYEAHFKEWMARKNQAMSYISGNGDSEIQVVASEFSDRIRIRSAKTAKRIAASKEKADAEIEGLAFRPDRSQAIAAANAKKQLALFMSGADMEVVNAIGASTNTSNNNLLDSVTSGRLFGF